MAVLLENPRRRRRSTRRRSTRRTRKTVSRRRRSNPSRRRRASSKRTRRSKSAIGGTSVQRLLMQAAASAATFWGAAFTTRALVNKFPQLNMYNPNAMQIVAGMALVFAKNFVPAPARRYVTPVGIGLTASGILGYIQGTAANAEAVADTIAKPSGIMYGPPRPPSALLRSRGVAGEDLLGADAMLFGPPELLGLGYDDPSEDLDGLGYTSFGGRA
jgi:hypothetical protein